MTAEDFLNKLEQRGFVPAEVVATLRQQVQKSIKIVSADAVAKLLVDKGKLTASQAAELLKPPKRPAPRWRLLTISVWRRLDDPFGLAPIDEPGAKSSDRRVRFREGGRARDYGETGGSRSDETGSGCWESSPAVARQKSAAKPQATAANKPAAPAPSGFGGGPLDDLLSDPSLAEGGFASAGGSWGPPRGGARSVR